MQPALFVTDWPPHQLQLGMPGQVLALPPAPPVPVTPPAPFGPPPPPAPPAAPPAPSGQHSRSVPHVYPAAQGLLVPHADVVHGLAPLEQLQSTTQPALS
jgi:hypothetical protein